MRSVMSHDFSHVPRADIPRSQFNRNCGYKTTFDAGYLVPVFTDEVLPGDTLNFKMNFFARLNTPIFPIMDNIRITWHAFFVPYRLVWDNFVKMMGEQTDPGDSTDYLFPTITATLNPSGAELSDYFGIPRVNGVTYMACYHRAYNLIWNYWYRDQDLQDSAPFTRGDGPDLDSTYRLLKRGKRFDYFTSCRPAPQKGPAQVIPLNASAPVITNGNNPTFSATDNTWSNKGLFGDSTSLSLASGATPNKALKFGNQSGLQADLTLAGGTINALRLAFQIQKLYERNQRGGTRYPELVRSHFGVTSPDARFQWPEYLGGHTVPVNIHPIAQTSATGTGDTPQGNLAAMGTSSSTGVGFTKSFTEHGMILVLASASADLTYQQGIERRWTRQGKFDIAWPVLSNVGEQAVLNKEIYVQGNSSDTGVFGYIPRFDDYRQKPSLVTGKFRSDAAGTLDAWVLTQDFGSLPTLNDTFIQENPPIDRVVATPDEPHFLFDSFMECKWARPLPANGVPGFVDHF